MFDVVTLAAPNVRPWKPPRKAMIPGRPVTRRASLSAASMASDPEFRKITVSIGSGRVAASRSASVATGWLNPIASVGPMSRSTWAWIAARDGRVVMAEGRDRDPVGEVEVGLAGRVEQAMALAVAPAPLEVATEDRRQRGGRVRKGRRQGSAVRPSGPRGSGGHRSGGGPSIG